MNGQLGHTGRMNIHLTPELERLLQEKVETGRYNSANEVVREALRLMEVSDLTALRTEEIRKKIAQGLQSLRAGNGVDGQAVFDRVEAELEAIERISHNK